MQPRRKIVRTARSREDHELFKISLTPYDPQLISSDYLRPEQPLATIYYREPPQKQPTELRKDEPPSLEQSVTTHMAGTVQTLGASFEIIEGKWRIKEEMKRGSLELLTLRQCQHTLKNQSMQNGNNKGHFNLPAGEICRLCERQIWIYTSTNQETITAEDLLKVNEQIDLQDLFQLEWSIIINEQFTPTTAIAKAKQQELNYPHLAKATYLLGEGQRPQLGTTIMKVRRVYCCHEKIIDQRCQYCLQQINILEGQEYNRYLFQLGGSRSQRSLTKGTALEKQEEQYISSILAKNKLILILDLDNTILHSNQMSDLSLGKILKLKEYFILPKLEMGQDQKIRQDFIIVKMRPFLKEFLFLINKIFEVYVYTKGTRYYADEICKWIRAQWAGESVPYEFSTWPQPPMKFLKETECFLPYRVVSRNQDSSLETKSMQNILPKRNEYHIILDDRRDVWGNSNSWYYTREYYYFTKKIKKPQSTEDVDHFMSSQEQFPPFKAKLVEMYNRVREDYPIREDIEVQTKENADYFLLFASHTFKKMHTYFFDLHRKNNDENNEKANKKPHSVDLSEIMRRLKLFLAKKRLKFYLTPNEDRGVNAISIVRRSLKMGAIVLKPASTQTPQFLIRGNNYIKYAKDHQEELRLPVEELSLRDLDNVAKPSEAKLIVNKDHLNNPKKEQQQIKVQEKCPQEPIQNIPSELQQPKAPFPVTQSSQPKIQKPQLSGQTYRSEFEQLKTLSQQGIPVISQTWIKLCYEYSYKFRSEDFKLNDPFRQDVTALDFKDIVVKSAEKIQKEITDQMSKELDGKRMNVKEKDQKSKQIKKVSPGKQGQIVQDKGKSIKQEGSSKKDAKPKEPKI